MPLGLIQYTLAIVSTSQCMIAIAVLLCPRSAIRDSVNQEETCRDVLVGQKPLLLATKKGPGFRVSASHLWCWLERRCRNYPDSDIIIPQPAGEVHKPPPKIQSPPCQVVSWNCADKLTRLHFSGSQGKSVVSSVFPAPKGGPTHYWILEVFG